MLLLALLLAPAAVAAGLRCDGRLVAVGATAYEVRAACGEPDHRSETRQLYLHGVVTLEREEVWYYNFGPRRLLRVLRFRDGRLARIDSAGYGFDPAAVAGQCRSRDIRPGMTELELLARCGEPAQRERRDRVRYPTDPPTFVLVVTVEEWVYDFGPGRFLRLITLEDGLVQRVEQGSRGFSSG